MKQRKSVYYPQFKRNFLSIFDLIDSENIGARSIATSDKFSIEIDLKSELLNEQVIFDKYVQDKNYNSLISRYPVRETEVLAKISECLGFQDRHKYESAVRKLIIDDSNTLSFFRLLLGDLSNKLLGTVNAIAKV